jgi:hypothetical protein
LWQRKEGFTLILIVQIYLEKTPGMSKDKRMKEIDLKRLASNYHYYDLSPYWESSIAEDNENKQG